MAACQSTKPEPTAEETCCACLESSSSPRGVPCHDADAGSCLTTLDEGRALKTGPACLRDVCGTACEPLGFRPPARGTLESCCRCLTTRVDTANQPCFSESLTTCTDALDDGKQLVTSAECLDTVCGTECAFLERTSRDGG
ncbi:MAG: hypothetical protein AB2A00_20500 [Myxococcota bacterium]